MAQAYLHPADVCRDGQFDGGLHINASEAQPIVVVVAGHALPAIHQGDVGLLAITLIRRGDEGRSLDVQAVEPTQRHKRLHHPLPERFGFYRACAFDDEGVGVLPRGCCRGGAIGRVIDFRIRVGAGDGNGNRAVIHTIVLVAQHRRMDFGHLNHQGISLRHLEAAKFHRVMRSVESAEHHLVFIHPVVKHKPLIHARAASGRTDGSLPVVDVHGQEVFGFQLIGAPRRREVVVVIIVNAEIERFRHGDEQSYLASVPCPVGIVHQSKPSRVGMVAVVLRHNVLFK